MADVFTGATSAAGAGQLADLVLTAYDRVARFALRSQTVFDSLARVKPGNLTSPGNPVSFKFWNDLTVDTTALSEVVDPDAVGLSEYDLTVTPKEHGKAVLLTLRLRVDQYLVGFEQDVANMLSWNLAETVDAIARDAFDASTNVDYVGQSSEGAITASDIVTAAEVRQKHAELVNDSVMPFEGGLYLAYISPSVSYDLKDETGDGAWVAPAQYVDINRLYMNEVGAFGGFRFVETPRVKLNTDGGSGTVDTYTTYFVGQEGIAKAESIAPHMVLGPVTDKFRRFQPLGWYGYWGVAPFREEPIRRLLSASSIGANS
jgi:N4-gp56 family major capsid protein